MFPDLGDYATEVLAAYGASIGLLVVIVLLSMRRSRKMRAQLDAVEARKDAASGK
ncbi:heme exporter protein CcmD [Octadecabacter sp. 1_MG-2023]|uniref:heme exporter protein CcmD n=1 Tax=unclassified Octadecabacter TaxID=196158 RepID=UPI001C086899|nr:MULTISPECIES: heme exporter protein CcmD [unclassified Octadecabacter]MBU2993745.1 heme exporter protein CcmD [Octadecabacter sp. B2R22]MDO6735410.1 heme exporter protein CcmD [Octadecabacter sp. 1_MG-2023]